MNKWYLQEYKGQDSPLNASPLSQVVRPRLLAINVKVSRPPAKSKPPEERVKVNTQRDHFPAMRKGNLRLACVLNFELHL